MKKVLALFSIIFIIGFISILIIKNDKQTEETPKILTELRDNGIIEGKREFIFSLENIGKNEAELQFLTWLEYNYSLQYLTYKEEVSPDGTTEHVDLKKRNRPRKLVLKPNERIDYRLHLSGYPKGTYEITVSPAVDQYNLGIQKIVFSIE
ncbi:hypothetical protein [Calidifontibacillus erzurumensis]|uniref:Intracellular proteinase inhibitor BsuPI n=1 Tax=Calidifontibacillus erzurumensis TaxID=2741433 RepID=A0A8J8KDK9_9BACI|nr:hypothetical protein [Calidifontibacillus erzurumensis]NSL53123.1 hypothetical protein [Calidifontibacillus erzurumensis]